MLIGREEDVGWTMPVASQWLFHPMRTLTNRREPSRSSLCDRRPHKTALCLALQEFWAKRKTDMSKVSAARQSAEIKVLVHLPTQQMGKVFLGVAGGQLH